MYRIVVDPDRLRTLAQRHQDASAQLHSLDGHLARILGDLEWEARQKANVDGQVNNARSRARSLADQAEGMGRYLSARALAFEEADRQGVEDLRTLPIFPSPRPTPTPAPDEGEDIEVVDLKGSVKALDDILKPIDWISDSKKASQVFRKALEAIGRLLNAATGQRGNIKLMREMGDVLAGTQKTVSLASDLYNLKDFQRYFAGELTNQEVATTAIKALIPIPLIDAKIATWFADNVPNPGGKWHGLVPGAE